MIRSRFATLAATFAVLAACTPKSAPPLTPILPGDGTTNTAEVVTPPAPPAPVDPWSGRTDLLTAPPAAAPRAISLPPSERFTLANGLEVIAVPSNALPTFSMQLAIKAGRIDEPRARLGIAELTANLLLKGTAKRDAVKFARDIEYVGGTLSANASYEATVVACGVMARDAKVCMGAVAEAVTSPRFAPDEIAQMKAQMGAGLQARLDDATQLASANAQNLLWTDQHVRGWVLDGADLTSLTKREVAGWHQAWFKPNNAVLVVAGAFETKKLRAELNRAFAGWKKGALPPHPSYAVPALSGTRIRLVDKPGQTQTQIRIAQYGIGHDDPRFFDATVFNYTLGGGAFSSRLMQVVRSEGGKTYGASSSFDRNMDRGSFVASTFTRNTEAMATTKLMLGELAKMEKSGPTEAEIRAAVDNLAGAYAMKFGGVGAVASALIAAELHGFNDRYVSDYPLELGKVTPDSAARAAADILDTTNYVVVWVGDAKDLEPQLKQAGWRYEKRAFNEPISAPAATGDELTEEAMLAGRKWVTEAIAAKGGAAKLRGIKALRMVAEGTAAEQGQSAKLKIERTLVVPDKARVSVTLFVQTPPIGIDIIINGGQGWQRSPQGVVEIPPAELAQVDKDRWREPELVLLRAEDKGAMVGYLRDDSIDGRAVAVVGILSADQKNRVLLSIDKTSKQVVRMEYADGGQVSRDDFSDFKPVDGIQVAHRRKSATGPRITEYVLTEVAFNPNLDPKLFEKP